VQGLVNFAGEIGNAIATLLPTFCYLAALGLFMSAGWGFWTQAQSHNPYRGRPWVPFVALVLSGAFASFPSILTMANNTAGTNLQVSIGALTSYTAPTVNGNLLGQTPGDAVVNIVTLFQGFFQAFGAMCCFFAMLTWNAVIAGRSNRSPGGCGVQFVFGIMLINVVTVATWLVAVFRT
jgi:hypothetical protein